MIRRPVITPENIDAVNAFYREHEPSHVLTALTLTAMSHMVKPNVHWASEAEGQVHELLRSGGRLMIPANHTDDKDPVTIASTVNGQHVLRPIRFDTVIPTKPSVLAEKHRRVRWALESVGAYPIFRPKDLPEDASEALKAKMGRAFLATSSYLIKERGKHIAGFPGAERNKSGDPTTVGTFQDGFSRILRSATRNTVKNNSVSGAENSNAVNMFVLPMGIWYPEKESVDNKAELDLQHPVVSIGAPYQMDWRDVDEVTERMQAEVQEQLNNSIALAA